tara:strand:+ start:4121 stop:7159 length:3039 start_codon:yes stop_codon:yes gene_type:complete
MIIKLINILKRTKTTMKYKFIYVFLLTLTHLFSGSINGYIVDQNDEPLIAVNISVLNTNYGNTTDEEGYFNISGLPPGKYTLFISYIGFYEKSIDFYISEREIQGDKSSAYYNQKLGLSFNDDTIETLKGVNIDGLYITLMPQLLDYDAVVVSASKKQEKVFDAPATISLVSQRKIRQFSGVDIGSALSKVKGMDVYHAGNGRTNINTRGFMAVFNGRFVTLMDGKKFADPIFRTTFNNTFPTIMEDIERLEVVFGPSSALYGPNAHNGLINIITKHPKDSPGMDFTLTSSATNHNSQRFRYAKAGEKLSYKINLENSIYTEWDPNRVYAPRDYNGDGLYSLEGEQFIDSDDDGMISTEDYYDANHDGVYSPEYDIEKDCFLFGCDIDGLTGIPIDVLDENGIEYDPLNIIEFESGDEVIDNGIYDFWDSFTDLDSNGTWDNGEPFTDSGNQEFDYKEEFYDCGYNLLGELKCEGDEGWDPSFGDGMHTGPEGVELFKTDFEKDLYTRKLLAAIYYQIDENAEITFEPTLIQQKNYIPYDLGYLFTTNTYSSFSTKLNMKNLNASMNADFLDGEVITGEELYNAALKLFNGDVQKSYNFLKENRDKTYKTTSYYGNLSGNFNNKFLNSITYGLDFRYDAPKTNRNILRDKGSNQKYAFDGSPLPEKIIGEDIKVFQYGAFTQFSYSPINRFDLILANRIDYHSHYDQFYFSPRVALKYSGFNSSNIRLTYNRAHQVPSLFHLFGNIYNQNTITFSEDLNGSVNAFNSPDNVDVYGNPIESPLLVEQPYVPLFSGNGEGFTVDDSIMIDPIQVEVVDSYEFGIKGMPFRNLFLDFNAYYSKFHNMTSTTQYIQTIWPHGQVPFQMNQLTHVGDQELDGRDILFTYVNLGEVEYFGMDVSLEYQIDYRTSFFSTYSYYNTMEIISRANETPYVGNDWAWTELIQDSKDVSPYDIMHFNAPNEKISFGISRDDFLLSELYFEFSGKYNSKFDFESGGWNYSEDDQNESYLYSGCG